MQVQRISLPESKQSRQAVWKGAGLELNYAQQTTVHELSYQIQPDLVFEEEA